MEPTVRMRVSLSTHKEMLWAQGYIEERMGIHLPLNKAVAEAMLILQALPESVIVQAIEARRRARGITPRMMVPGKGSTGGLNRPPVSGGSTLRAR